MNRTIQIDNLKKQIIESLKNKNKCQSIVGIGGGSILDITIALSLMINNSGKNRKISRLGQFKKGINSIGIPTISEQEQKLPEFVC